MGRIDEALLEAKDISDISLREAIANYGLIPPILPDAVITPTLSPFSNITLNVDPCSKAFTSRLALWKPLSAAAASLLNS